MYRIIGSILLASVLLAGSANAQRVTVSGSGTVTATATYQCQTSQWSISAPFNAGTSAAAFLAAVQAQLLATPAFINDGATASIFHGKLIIDPGSDPNVLIQDDAFGSACGAFTPLNGATCNGLSFLVSPSVPTTSPLGIIGFVSLLTLGGIWGIKRQQSAAKQV